MSPFRSERQKRYLWSQHPKIAARWSREQKQGKRRKERQEKRRLGGKA